jgi:subtilisin family serine protease
MKLKTSFATVALAVAAVSAQAQAIRPWMSVEVGQAWSQGYRGQGTTITVVDDFSSSSIFRGNLNGVVQVGRHGDWTYTESKLIAPLATMRAIDFNSRNAVPLNRGLNVLNLSYGMMAPAGYTNVGWSTKEASIINYAKTGTAIIAKAAGNDSGVAVGAADRRGQLDYLNRDLIGSQTAIFVGALSTNGTVNTPAKIASYSNVAGTNVAVQNKFLVVGVDSAKTGLAGTSFAAPVISGYAAILGSKFKTATPVQITNQLLNTARRDTIAGYNVAIHGKGEASIARALAPVSIK